MKRYRDSGDSPDPTVALAARLFGAVPRMEPSEAEVAQALSRLDRRKHERSSLRRLLPVLATLFLIGLSAVASARYGRAVWQWIRPAGSVSTPPRSAVAPSASAFPPSPAPAIAAPAVEPAVPSSALPDAATASRDEVRAARSRLATSTLAGGGGETRDAGHAGSAIVTAAYKALRHDHDPRRASVLLEDYLRHHAHGPLVEEALGLAIEATMQLDDPRAAVLAARYLRRFPAGLFEKQARRARERFGP